jgi:hypothetical protein
VDNTKKVSKEKYDRELVTAYFHIRNFLHKSKGFYECKIRRSPDRFCYRFFANDGQKVTAPRYVFEELSQKHSMLKTNESDDKESPKKFYHFEIDIIK